MRGAGKFPEAAVGVERIRNFSQRCWVKQEYATILSRRRRSRLEAC